MAGTIVTDRIESDATYDSKIELASPVVISNTFTIPAGTVGAPALSPAGDTNTGIYFPSADTVAFVTAGVERVRYRSDGFEYNPKKLVAANLDAWPGASCTSPNFNYQVYSNDTIPNGQHYIAEFFDVAARGSSLTTSNCRGVTFQIGYCNDSVSDGAVTNTTVNPAGYTQLVEHWAGWQTQDPTNGGFAIYNNGTGFGWLLPLTTSFTMPFTFNVAGKKLVLKVKLNGSGGSILMNEGPGKFNIYQVSSVSE
jgi:hypothetical protein